MRGTATSPSAAPQPMRPQPTSISESASSHMQQPVRQLPSPMRRAAPRKSTSAKKITTRPTSTATGLVCLMQLPLHSSVGGSGVGLPRHTFNTQQRDFLLRELSSAGRHYKRVALARDGGATGEGR